MPFKKGKSGNPKGRPGGSKNKLTTIKDAVFDTFHALEFKVNVGTEEEVKIKTYKGLEAFKFWAEHNPDEFYKIAAKLLPRDVNVDQNTNITIIDKAVSELDRTLEDAGIVGESAELSAFCQERSLFSH